MTSSVCPPVNPRQQGRAGFSAPSLKMRNRKEEIRLPLGPQDSLSIGSPNLAEKKHSQLLLSQEEGVEQQRMTSESRRSLMELDGKLQVQALEVATAAGQSLPLVSRTLTQHLWTRDQREKMNKCGSLMEGPLVHFLLSPSFDSDVIIGKYFLTLGGA